MFFNRDRITVWDNKKILKMVSGQIVAQWVSFVVAPSLEFCNDLLHPKLGYILVDA